MTAKEYLRQYYNLTKEIEMLDKELADLTAEIETTNINLDGMPKGSNIADKTGTLAAKLADTTLEIMDMRTKAWKKRQEVLQAVRKVKQPAYRELLYRRYIQLQSFERIAVDMDYSYSRVRHMHGEALLKVSTP